jgi:D-alanine-D-alanine ligase-like ATP-grasp enzyme
VSDATNVAALSSKLGLENGLFVKPEHGYDSVGIDDKSLVFTVTDLQTRVDMMVEQFGGALIEQYVDGREFSVLVAGSKDKMEVFPPVEYVFPKDRQRAAAAAANPTGVAQPTGGPSFITFQDKWGANFENRWHMLDSIKEADNCVKLRDIAFKLYEAFDGQGNAPRITFAYSSHMK